MYRRCTLPLAALALLVAAPSAAATVDLTAFRIRMAEHPGSVRAVVDLTDGTITPNDVALSSGDIDARGVARIDVTRRNAQAQAASRSLAGLRVSVSQLAGATGLRVRLSADARRFKYVGYSVLHGPERLVIDVFRRAATDRLTFGRCLSIGSTSSTARRVAATGRVRVRLFENTFRLRLRRSDGRAIAGRSIISEPGAWSSALRHRETARRRGVLEALTFSAKDGALECLAQVPVTLRP